jgi:hypothetical protein
MSLNSPDISASRSGSRLLSMDSPTFPPDSSHSRTGPGGDDLSLSELSISNPDSIMNKPFSLLARFNPPPRSPTDLATPTRENKTGASSEGHHAKGSGEIVDAELQDEEDTEATRKKTQELRDEKLKSDMFILKKLNTAFELFEEALEETGSANEVCSRPPF